MRKLFCVAVLFLLAGWVLRSQTLTTYTIIHSGTLANCAPVVSGQTQSCYAQEGLAISIKGSPYVLVPLATAVGVSSISVNGGTPQTGAVAIKVPSVATSITTTTIQ